jgi:adenosylcobinamide-GDP ribazoletransferase
VRRALAFLTPVGGAVPPSPAALPWFPLVGALIGATVGLAWYGAGRAWSPAVAAAVAVVVDLTLTGMLHLDGLVDAADGLLPPLAPERRLEVMDGPEVGAFGVGAAVASLLLRWAALAALTPSPLLLGALWCASRTMMAATVLGEPYARPETGLVRPFRGAGPRAEVVAAAGILTAALLGFLWRPVPGPLAVLGCVFAALGVVALARRRIGGFTGDVLGAAGVVGETAGLLVAAARW